MAWSRVARPAPRGKRPALLHRLASHASPWAAGSRPGLGSTAPDRRVRLRAGGVWLLLEQWLLPGLGCLGRAPTPVGDAMAAPAPSTPVMIPARGRELERRPAAPVPGASLPVAHGESAGRRLLSPLLAACASNDLQLVRYAIERDLHSVDQSDEWCVARRQPGAKSGLPASSEILTPAPFAPWTLFRPQVHRRERARRAVVAADPADAAHARRAARQARSPWPTTLQPPSLLAVAGPTGAAAPSRPPAARVSGLPKPPAPRPPFPGPARPLTPSSPCQP